MATNCYEFEIPVDVCVDGPVGGGATATLTVQMRSGGDGGSYLVESPSVTETVPGWDGSEVEFTGWSEPGSWGNCDVESTSLKVKLIGDNTVQVDLRVEVSGCDEFGDIGFDCEGEGPHVFTDTKIIDITGAGCPSLPV